jgi:hypothetical protein
MGAITMCLLSSQEATVKSTKNTRALSLANQLIGLVCLSLLQETMFIF